jgi:hypothetical protein
LLLAIDAANLWADAELSGTNPAQWRLIWKSDPATKATLSWNTAEPGTTHRVHLREEGETAFTLVDCQRNGKYSTSKPRVDLFYHHARLTGLKPETKYVATLESDGRKSREFRFATAPADDVALSILFGGDSRSDREMRRSVNGLMRRMVAEAAAAGGPPIVALAHGGDYIGDGRNISQWSTWMSDHELTTGDDGRLLPIIPARGNHDRGRPFNEIFDFSLKDRNYYAQSLGPQVRFITLNSETASGGDQQAWLDAELAASRTTHRWLAAQYHTPAYPAVKMPGPAYSFWVPLFERHRIDLVCEADGHCIKRTAPILNHQVDQAGVVYIGEGGLGVGQRTPKSDRWYLREPHGKCGSGHHLQLLTFAKDRLTYRVILIDGTVFDEHHLSPREISRNSLD